MSVSFRSAAILLLLPLLTGCGGKEAPSEDQTPKATSVYRRVLSAAETGKLESPETLTQDVAALSAEGVPNVDALQKKANELKAAKTPDAVKARANEMLGILPP